jgi:hypothetical protein
MSTGSFFSSFIHEERRKTDHIVDEINAILDYLMIVVKDLNFFSNKESGTLININKCDFNLKRVLLFIERVSINLLSRFNKLSGVKLEIKVEKDVPKIIHTDEDALKQILINLLTNSIKHTYEGFIKLNICKEDSMIKFQVTDSGIGIKEECKQKIFNNNYNQIGLTIVHDLTLQLGYPIQFTSEDDKGTSFWFYINTAVCYPTPGLKSKMSDISGADIVIDIVSNRSAEISLISINSEKTIELPNIVLSYPSQSQKKVVNIFNSHDKISGNHKNVIIIVDDEKMTRNSNIRIFTEIAEANNIPLTIFEAEDGLECLYLIFMCMKFGLKISMILSDQTMNFLNGSSLLNIIRNCIDNSVINKIPFYILTAYEDESTLVLLRNSSPNEIYSKPLKKNIAQDLILNHIK